MKKRPMSLVPCASSRLMAHTAVTPATQAPSITAAALGVHGSSARIQALRR